MQPFLSKRAQRGQGLSLIELMIAIALGMVVVGALLALFLNVTRTNNEMAKMNRQIENGRFAIQLLQSDLVHAGFWGNFIPQFEDRGVAVPGDVPKAIPDPCKAPADWNADDRSNLIGIPVQADAGSCAAVASQAAGTDVLVVRHAEPTVGSAACGAGEVCFQASQCGLEITATPPQKYVFGTTGHTLHKKDCVGTGSPPVMPVTAGSTALMRKLISNIYYVRDDFTLMRSEYLNGAHQAAQPLIEGIQGFRVEYGIDNVGKNGAAVSYTAAAPVITTHFPQLAELWFRIGGEQVRNMGTVGGNIANGSPIGDTPPPLIALGASITLRKGSERREVKLKDYFVAYGKQDRQPGEFVESVTIPLLPQGERFACYKITKRRDEDISALCGAFRLFVNEAGKVGMVRIAFGGMAATPKRAIAVEEALVGKPWTTETIEAAIPAFAADYQPITDMRASADYRLLAAQNLLRRFFLETTGKAERLVREVA